MKLLSTRLLTYCIIGSMLLQVAISVADFHLHSPTDQAHTHVHTSDNQADSIVYEVTESHEHHCYHCPSNSLVVAIHINDHLPKSIVQIPLYTNNFYQPPIFDALIRPPIS